MARTRLVTCPYCYHPVEVDKADVLDGHTSRHDCSVLKYLTEKMGRGPESQENGDTDDRS